MKNKIIILSVILFSSVPAFAQVTSAPVGVGAQANLETISSSGIGKTYDNRYEGSKGTPFLVDEYVNAQLILNGNVTLQNVPLKYNVFDNAIVYKDAKGNVLAFNTNQVSKLTYNDLKTGAPVVLGKLAGLAAENQKAADKLVNFLYDGEKTKFAVLPLKELIKADFKGSTYSSGRTYDEFFDKTEYYLKGKNGSVEKVKLNKKNLLSSLADKENEIKAFISNEKIDFSTEQGWVKVLTYYETL
jgi:hypothetical protein